MTELADVEPGSVDVVATFPGLYLTPSQNAVTPVLGWWREPGPLRVVDPGEVVLEPFVDARGDVAAELPAVQRDLVQRDVGALARLAERRPEGHHVEHAAPRGDECAVAIGGRRVGEVHARDGGGGIHPGDRPAGRRSLRIPLAREHDRHRARLGECRSRVLLEATGCRRQQQLGERVGEPRQHHLRLGIAETRVELDDLHAVVGEDQAGVEQSDERCALGIQPPHDRLGHLGRDKVDERLLAAEPPVEPGER